MCVGCLLELQETGQHQQLADNELYYRLAGRVPLAGASALFYFDKRGRFKRMIQALKYKNRPQVGRYLGEYYGEKLRNLPIFTQADALVPVPLHRSRQAERGYNQSEMIAEGLSKTLGVPVNTKALLRSSKTTSQTKKTQSERWENVEHAFEMKQPIAGRILLIDDVITTGATLEACIRCLYRQPTPPESIHVLSLGMARHD